MNTATEAPQIPANAIRRLPGAELVMRGIADWNANRITPEACLAAIALPRLERIGLLPENSPPPGFESERELYRLLRAQAAPGDDPYTRYNSLLRELVSFERALDHLTEKAESGE